MAETPKLPENQPNPSIKWEEVSPEAPNPYEVALSAMRTPIAQAEANRQAANAAQNRSAQEQTRQNLQGQAERRPPLTPANNRGSVPATTLQAPPVAQAEAAKPMYKGYDLVGKSKEPSLWNKMGTGLKRLVNWGGVNDFDLKPDEKTKGAVEVQKTYGFVPENRPATIPVQPARAATESRPAQAPQRSPVVEARPAPPLRPITPRSENPLTGGKKKDSLNPGQPPITPAPSVESRPTAAATPESPPLTYQQMVERDRKEAEARKAAGKVEQRTQSANMEAVGEQCSPEQLNEIRNEVVVATESERRDKNNPAFWIHLTREKLDGIEDKLKRKFSPEANWADSLLYLDDSRRDRGNLPILEQLKHYIENDIPVEMSALRSNIDNNLPAQVRELENQINVILMDSEISDEEKAQKQIELRQQIEEKNKQVELYKQQIQKLSQQIPKLTETQQKLEVEIQTRQGLHGAYLLFKKMDRKMEQVGVEYGDLSAHMNNELLENLFKLSGELGENKETLGAATDYAYRFLWTNVARGMPIEGEKVFNLFSNKVSPKSKEKVFTTLAKVMEDKLGVDTFTASQAVNLSFKLFGVLGDADGVEASCAGVYGREIDLPENKDTTTFSNKAEIEYQLGKSSHRVDKTLYETVRDENNQIKHKFRLKFRNLISGEQDAESSQLSKLMDFGSYRVSMVVKGRGYELDAEQYNVPGRFNLLPRRLLLPMMDLLSVRDETTNGAVSLRELVKKRGFRNIDWDNLISTRENEFGQPEQVSNLFESYGFFVYKATEAYKYFTSNGEDGVIEKGADKMSTTMSQLFSSNPQLVAENLQVDVGSLDESTRKEYLKNLKRNFMILAFQHSFTEAGRGMNANVATNETNKVLNNMVSIGVITLKESDAINKMYNPQMTRQFLDFATGTDVEWAWSRPEVVSNETFLGKIKG